MERRSFILLRLFEGPEQLLRAATTTRRWSRLWDRAGDPSLLFCLAPRRVCRAPVLTLGAVGSYPAVSPLLSRPALAIARQGPARSSGLFSVTLSVAKNFRSARPCFRKVGCLMVSGLSSPVSCVPGATARQQDEHTCALRSFKGEVRKLENRDAWWHARRGLTREASPLSVADPRSVPLKSVGNSTTAKS